jgi:TonB family protein
MRSLWVNAILVAAATGLAASQQTTSPNAGQQKGIDAERVKVYGVGPRVTAPEFIPTNLPPIISERCKKKMDGKVELSLLVDTTGRTRNLMFIHPLGNDLDRLALRIVGADRFTPAMSDGTPVVVAEKVDVSLQACLEEESNQARNKTYKLKLRSQPARKYETKSPPSDEALLTPGDGSWDEGASGAVSKFTPGKGMSPPTVLNNPPAEFTEEARKAGFTGSCKLSMIVDAQGMLQDVEIVQPLGYGLDQEAAKVAREYRFKPAMRNGDPFPVRITVDAIFRNN